MKFKESIGIPPLPKAKLLELAKPLGNGIWELADDDYKRLALEVRGNRPFVIDALDAEIKRATGQTPCRGCGG